MKSFQRISVAQTKHMLAGGDIALVDIRDALSYKQGHIDGALLLDNDSISQFIDATSKTQPVVVYCYHGNSSQNAAQYLVEQGFEEVYSMDGGYEGWRVS